MGLLLIILGLVFWFTISHGLGIICLIIGLILFFVPFDGVYGYNRYRGRR